VIWRSEAEAHEVKNDSYQDTPAEDDRSMSLLSSRHEEGAASGGADVTANALPHAVPARAVRPLRSGYALEGTDASPV
jgi:hypothetical protein